MLPFLERKYWVLFQITYVDSFAFLLNVRMFSTQQPTNMRKEESSLCVIRVCICLAIFMMNSVIFGPVNCSILSRKKIRQN